MRQTHLVASIVLGEQHIHLLRTRGRNDLADIVGMDGQLTMASVDEHEKLDAPRSAIIEKGFECRPNGASSEEHIVDQQHIAPFKVARHRRLTYGGLA